jgi:hypothetical protein
MTKRKADAEKLVTVQAPVPVVIWRANRPLTEQQHEEIARKLEVEHERSGLKVMLVPNSAEVEIGVNLEELAATQAPIEALPDDKTANGGAEQDPTTQPSK